MLTPLTSIKSFFSVAVVLVAVGCASAPEAPAPEPESATLNYARFGHTAVADNEAIYVFGGASENGFIGNIERIDPVTKISTVLPVRMLPRRYGSAVWDGGELIYIFGGVGLYEGHYRIEPTIEIFNTRTRKVSRTKMLLPRRLNSAARVGEHIYVVGGSTLDTDASGNGEFRAMSLVTAYDFANEQLNRRADLPDARDTKVFTYGDQLCAVGGYNHKNTFARFDCYNPATDTWQAMPDMPSATSAHSVALHGDKLYVFGNYSKLDQALVFDFNTQQWSDADLPYQASRHNTAVTFGNEIFVIGGTTDTKGPALDTIQVFTVGE